MKIWLLFLALSAAFIAGGNVSVLMEDCGGYTTASVVIEALAFGSMSLGLAIILIVRGARS